MINNGQMQFTNNEVGIFIYYDATSLPVGDTQPLINGPEGYCMLVRNPLGRKINVTLTRPNGAQLTVAVDAGDPVTTGPGRSRTAAEMAALGGGFTTRGDVQGFSF